jgi:hypothetical protein
VFGALGLCVRSRSSSVRSTGFRVRSRCPKVRSPEFRARERLPCVRSTGRCIGDSERGGPVSFLSVRVLKKLFRGKLLLDLARYTHRVAITNTRLVHIEGEEVTFTWKDYADHDRRAR